MANQPKEQQYQQKSQVPPGAADAKSFQKNGELNKKARPESDENESEEADKNIQ